MTHLIQPRHQGLYQEHICKIVQLTDIHNGCFAVTTYDQFIRDQVVYVECALRTAPDVGEEVAIFWEVDDVDAVFVDGGQDVQGLEGFVGPDADAWRGPLLPSGDEFACLVGL